MEVDVTTNVIIRTKIGIDVAVAIKEVADEIMKGTETIEIEINEVDPMKTSTQRGTEDTSARRMTNMVETHDTSRSARDLAETTTGEEETMEAATTVPLDPDLRQVTIATSEAAIVVVVETEVDSEEVVEEALGIEVDVLVAVVIETMLRLPRTHTRCK